jgi:hypothetical protein
VKSKDSMKNYVAGTFEMAKMQKAMPAEQSVPVLGERGARALRNHKTDPCGYKKAEQHSKGTGEKSLRRHFIRHRRAFVQ